MNLFWILAIGLTVLYVIYYTVIIMHDLYSKKGDEQKNESEDIEVPDAENSEQPTVIDEVDDDPIFGESSEGDGITLVDNIYDVEDVVRQEAIRHSAAEECKRLSAELNEIHVTSTGETEKDEFVEMLVKQPAGGRKIFLTRDNV